MATDHTLAGSCDEEEAEVMASIDESGDAERLVIADVTRDEAWLSTAAGCAAELPAWR